MDRVEAQQDLRGLLVHARNERRVYVVIGPPPPAYSGATTGRAWSAVPCNDENPLARLRNDAADLSRPITDY